MDDGQLRLIPLDECYFAYWMLDGIPHRYVPITETPHYRFARKYIQDRDDPGLSDTGYGYYAAWESYCVHLGNTEKKMGDAHTEMRFAANIDNWRDNFDIANHPIIVRKIGEGKYAMDDGARRAAYSVVVAQTGSGVGKINLWVRRMFSEGENGWRNWVRGAMDIDVCKDWWQDIPQNIRELFEKTR